MRLEAMISGWVIGPFRGEQHGDIRLPVPCFVIHHPQGMTLVDSGLHPGMRDDPHARIGWVADVLRFELDASQDVLSLLGAAAVELIVQRREWEAGSTPEQIESNHYNPDDYRQQRPVRVVDGAHDLYGDGSVLLIPTPGHTPGHQSLRVQLDGGELVLCADACYFADWMDSEEMPPYGFDKQQELESLCRLRALRDGGAQPIFGHDPEQWAALPKAPSPLGRLSVPA